VQSAGRYHLEAVASKVGLLIYLLDEAEKELPVADLKGTVLLTPKQGAPPVEADLEPMGNHLHARVDVSGDWTAVVMLQVSGERLTARFQGQAAVRTHQAGLHQHVEVDVGDRGVDALELAEVYD
jgi:hypothetical protein